MKKRNIPIIILVGVLLFVGVLALISAIWYINIYGDIGFSAIIFTLTTNNESVEEGIINSYILKALLPACTIYVIMMILLWWKPDKSVYVRSLNRNQSYLIFPFSRKVSMFVSLFLIVALLLSASFTVSLPQYLVSVLNNTEFYDKEYVDPDKVEIKFPGEKKNVIYILLESMETSFFSMDEGGGLEYNVIPELYTLASENVSFSHTLGIGGWPVVTNATWTIASIVSQTSGVPLSVTNQRNTYGKDTPFLPGITSITDILKNNGYYQAVMFGSEGNYAGRDQYYYQHGADVVYDLFTAREDGVIPDDYKVWWGMEDLHLYEYAKMKLPEIASGDKPFMFTMLTVDTHHIGGYKCELCGDTYDEKYENVYSCASKQVTAFVDWIKDQDFYEDTLIVVCGDHASMDAAYFERNVENDYDRHIYNCFINSSVEPTKTKERVFTPFDMFPSTLAAMGCEIEGNRLGLGTNLFSGLPTLAEVYGIEELNDTLGKTSYYYNDNFLK